MPCETYLLNGTTISICRSGPTKRVYPTDGQEYSAVYCWKCKQRTVHRDVNICEIEPSYYEPRGALECQKCGTVK